MIIPINIAHAFKPTCSRIDNALALRDLLDCMIALNMSFLRKHRVPPLYSSGVTYGRTHIWEPISALYLPNKTPLNRVFWEPRGVSGGERRGDCKSLATARIAELRLAGKHAEPVFRWAKRPVGNALDFHILVQTPEGWEDPSRKLGMGKVEIERYE